MIDQSFSKSKDLGDMLRFLPGVVVQKLLSMQGMVDLYRIKQESLERLIKSAIEPLRPSSEPLTKSATGPLKPSSKSLTKSAIEPLRPSSKTHDLYPRYILDGYLSGLLQDPDRSQLYHCDPELQHISICRQFLSLLDRSNFFDLQS
jgi:hypothetical protein